MPKIHPHIAEFLKDISLVSSLSKAFGSPLNIMFPQNVRENIQSFQRVYDTTKLRGKICIAHKPNKSHAVMTQVAQSGIYIDVASLGELESALCSGFSGERIEATGPKNDVFISLGISHDILFNVDSLEEIKSIVRIKQNLKHEKKIRILTRLNKFTSDHVSLIQKDSRFGIPLDQKAELFSLFKQHSQEIEFVGVSFHIVVGGESEKYIALENALQFLVEAQKEGFAPNILNIGGGFKTQFVDNQEEWDNYITALKQSLLDNSKSLSWNNSGLGYKVDDAVLKGSPTFFQESFISSVGAQEFEKILSRELPTFGSSFLEIAYNLGLEVYIEPGRSLFDQTGITLAQVLDVKKSALGETVVILDMNRSNLNTFDLELMADPIIIPQRSQERVKEAFGVYFAGNLCLPNDILLRHKTFLSALPERGDIVVFVNTAAYFMDFSESHTLQQKIAEKIAVTKTPSSFQWCLDKEYFASKFE